MEEAEAIYVRANSRVLFDEEKNAAGSPVQYWYTTDIRGRKRDLIDSSWNHVVRYQYADYGETTILKHLYKLLLQRFTVEWIKMHISQIK